MKWHNLSMPYGSRYIPDVIMGYQVEYAGDDYHAWGKDEIKTSEAAHFDTLKEAKKYLTDKYGVTPDE